METKENDKNTEDFVAQPRKLQWEWNQVQHHPQAHTPRVNTLPRET